MSKNRNSVSRANIQQSNQELIYAEQVHLGPLPHPEIMKGYDMVVPGAAERILKMAETQSEHRQSIEKEVIQTQTRITMNFSPIWGIFLFWGLTCYKSDSKMLS